MGNISGVEFVEKKKENSVSKSFSNLSSCKRSSLNGQWQGFCKCWPILMVIVVGTWSKRNMGSIVVETIASKEACISQFWKKTDVLTNKMCNL